MGQQYGRGVDAVGRAETVGPGDDASHRGRASCQQPGDARQAAHQSAHLVGVVNVVEQEEQVERGGSGAQRGQGGAAVVLPRGPLVQVDADEPGDVADNLVERLAGREGQRFAAVVEVGEGVAKELLGQARLAHAARADDSHRAAAGQVVAQRGQLRLAPGKGGQHVGAIVAAMGNGGRRGRR